MNIWFITVFCLSLTLIPVTIATVRGDALDRVIGMALGGIIVTLGLISMAVGSGKSIYIDVAIVVAFLSFAGGIAFPHFLERWL
jgi:multisubunit Na+/H+ antiporter MnhF subunit